MENYMLEMIETMRSTGYVQRKDDDVACIMIGPGGEIHKSNAGDHRFIIAKLVGVKSMPFMVKGVHEGYLKQGVRSCNLESIAELRAYVERACRNAA